MIEISLIDEDINLKKGFDQKALKETRYGLCRYIADVCSIINV